VTVACQGSAIRLVGASPNPGYQMIVNDSGPEQVDVSFTNGNGDRQVTVVCSGGRPVLAN